MSGNIAGHNRSQSHETTADNLKKSSTYSLYSYHLNKSQIVPNQAFKENMGINVQSKLLGVTLKLMKIDQFILEQELCPQPISL